MAGMFKIAKRPTASIEEFRSFHGPNSWNALELRNAFISFKLEWRSGRLGRDPLGVVLAASRWVNLSQREDKKLTDEDPGMQKLVYPACNSLADTNNLPALNQTNF